MQTSLEVRMKFLSDLSGLSSNTFGWNNTEQYCREQNKT